MNNLILNGETFKINLGDQTTQTVLQLLLQSILVYLQQKSNEKQQQNLSQPQKDEHGETVYYDNEYADLLNSIVNSLHIVKK